MYEPKSVKGIVKASEKIPTNKVPIGIRPERDKEKKPMMRPI